MLGLIAQSVGRGRDCGYNRWCLKCETRADRLVLKGLEWVGEGMLGLGGSRG
jgi:hypothetical protein